MTPLTLNVLKLGKILIGCAGGVPQPGHAPPADGKKAIDVLERRVLEELRQGIECDPPLSEAILFVEKAMGDDSYAAMVKRRLRCVAVIAAAELLGEGPGDRSTANIARIMAWGGEGDGTARTMACRAVIATLLEDDILQLPANPSHWDRATLSEGLLQWIGSDAYIPHSRMCRLANRTAGEGQPQPATTPSFTELRERIRKHVIGLDEQTDALAARLTMHTARIKLLDKGESPETGNEFILIVGKSGSGKSYLIKKAAEASSLAYAMVDATAVTASGYVGGDIDDGIKILLRQTSGQGDARGIYVLDEFDKRMSDGGVLSIQPELLTMISGSKRIIGGKRPYDIPPMLTDTRFLCYAACGTFPDLQKRMLKRNGGGAIGFGDSASSRRADWISALKDCGMLEELANRLTAILMLPIPTVDSIVKVAVSEHGIIASQNRLLTELGVKIQVDRLGVRYAAGLAVEEGSYIRGVHRLITRLAETAVALGHSMRYSVGDVRRVMEEMDGLAPQKPSESGERAPTFTDQKKEEAAWLS
jgi:ATP-dependent Clp protease ATP-binding subunit ClpX